MKKAILFLFIFFFSHTAFAANHDPAYTVLGQLFNWKQSWEKKDIDLFMSFYDTKSKFSGKSYNAFKGSKKKTFRKSGKITVFISDLCVKKSKRKIITSFIQDYFSDKNRYTGRKSLTWKTKAGEWKIFSKKYEKMSDKLRKNVRDNKIKSLAGLKVSADKKKEILFVRINESQFGKIGLSSALDETFKFVLDFPDSYSINKEEPSLIGLRSNIIEGVIFYRYNDCKSKRALIFLKPNRKYNVNPVFYKKLSVLALEIG